MLLSQQLSRIPPHQQIDIPWFYEGNPVEAAPNMIFFIHIILANSGTQRAMTLGQTVRVTQSGCEGLSRLPLDLIVK